MVDGILGTFLSDQRQAEQHHPENIMLHAEIDNFKKEKLLLQEVIRKATCLSYGGPTLIAGMSIVHFENVMLRAQLQRLHSMATRYRIPLEQLRTGIAPSELLPYRELHTGMPSECFTEPSAVGYNVTVAPPAHHIAIGQIPTSMMIKDEEKPSILRLARTAAEELLKMSCINEPLWIGGGSCSWEILNMEEHAKMFSWPVDLNQQFRNFRTDGSRDWAIIAMDSVTLVEAFLDANKWMETFPSIVSKAKTVQVISENLPGQGNACFLMRAELQFISPLVAVRKTHFFRYHDHKSEQGKWVIVDFSIDGYGDGPQMSVPWYRRRTSGCVIQDLRNGYSRVTWVERAEVDDKQLHNIFDQLVDSALIFGATRWVSTLQKYCEQPVTLVSRKLSDLGVHPSPKTRGNMMKLSNRMTRIFHACMSSSGAQWRSPLSDSDETFRVASRINTYPGQPSGLILTVASTTWLPFFHRQLFDILAKHPRTQMDELRSGCSSFLKFGIDVGLIPDNCISLLQMNSPDNPSENAKLLLHERRTCPSLGSLMIYATMDINAVQAVMSNEDTSAIPILPSGFLILPAKVPNSNNSNRSSTLTVENFGNNELPTGCLLTVGIQDLISEDPSARLARVKASKERIDKIVNEITTLLARNVKEVHVAKPPGDPKGKRKIGET